MKKEEFRKYKLDLKLINDISFIKVDKIEEHDSYVVELFLKSLYYYHKLEDKLIDYENTPDGIYEFINFLASASNRKTDVLDSLFLMHCLKDNKDNLFKENYQQLYAELGGHRRSFGEDIDKVLSNTETKISVFYQNLE